MDEDGDLGELKRSIRQGWEEVAVEYAKDRSGIFRQCSHRLVDILHPRQGSSLLDVGCGSGIVTRDLRSKVGNNGIVIGADISEKMLRIGLGHAQERNLAIRFCQMDAECTSLASATMDVVTCAFSLFQFPKMETALREMWRVLKPGGCLGLSNWGAGYFSPIASLQRDLFKNIGIRPLLSNPITFRPHNLEDMLARSGFTSIELTEEEVIVWFTSPEEVWEYNMDMGPFPVMLETQLSSEQRKELSAQFIDLIDNLNTENGIKSTFHIIYATAEKGGQSPVVP